MRHLEKEVIHTGRVVLHTAARLDQLPQAMDILVDLHQQRRQMLGERGCFASPPFLGFYRDVVPELLRRGQVQLYWLDSTASRPPPSIICWGTASYTCIRRA